MNENDESDLTQSQQGALFSLIEASQDLDLLKDYRIIAAAFEDGDYQAIIDLAWRHQFDSERLHFKRQIRELQEHVCSRIRPIREVVE
jgi:hypothetical protein